MRAAYGLSVPVTAKLASRGCPDQRHDTGYNRLGVIGGVSRRHGRGIDMRKYVGGGC